MSTYHNVKSAGLQPLLNVRYLLGCPETAHIIYIAREILQSVPEGIEVLQGQNGGRYKDRNLLAVSYSLEGRTYGYFGLSESHIAAHETVHRAVVFHIPLHGIYSLLLIRSILVHERRLKFLLHVCICRESESLDALSLRIKLYEVLCYILYLRLRAGLQVLPCLRSELMDLRRL